MAKLVNINFEEVSPKCFLLELEFDNCAKAWTWLHVGMDMDFTSLEVHNLSNMIEFWVRKDRDDNS